MHQNSLLRGTTVAFAERTAHTAIWRSSLAGSAGRILAAKPYPPGIGCSPI
jgi:hypothetical protein